MKLSAQNSLFIVHTIGYFWISDALVIKLPQKKEGKYLQDYKSLLLDLMGEFRLRPL